jgi:hypothetical protein
LRGLATLKIRSLSSISSNTYGEAFLSDPDELNAAMLQIRANGKTVLYDAVASARWAMFTKALFRDGYTATRSSAVCGISVAGMKLFTSLNESNSFPSLASRANRVQQQHTVGLWCKQLLHAAGIRLITILRVSSELIEAINKLVTISGANWHTIAGQGRSSSL